MKYNKVTPELISKIAGIIGDKYVITDEGKLSGYSCDETPKHYAHMPELVIQPQSAQEIAEIVKLANRELIPITPRGSGTGLSGGAIPVFGGIVISFERMNRIIEIDYGNMTAVVEPGLITNEINVATEGSGLFYAGYPMSVLSCSIGGNIAENAGGGKAIKYGVTDRYVLGLELVTPTGEIVQLGGKLIKDVTGYNLKQLIIGSEGTLGIVTKITLKLSPMPKFITDLLALFKDTQSAIELVPKIMMKTGIVPTSIEYMDNYSVKISCESLNENLPYEGAGAMLLIELDGTREEQVEADADAVGELCFEHGALEVYVADNHTTRERIWSVRRNINEAMRSLGCVQTDEDTVVPISAIPEFTKGMEEISKKHNVHISCFGHAGDGNLHPTIMKNENMSMDEWYETEDKVLRELYALCGKLGGKISGEHGVGCKRRKYLDIVLSDAEIEMMKKIKQALDPNSIMNPGKIFL
jgi:glycolate oxidase